MYTPSVLDYKGQGPIHVIKEGTKYLVFLPIITFISSLNMVGKFQEISYKRYNLRKLAKQYFSHMK